MKRLLAICLLLWVGLGIHTASAAEAVTQNDLSNFKELHQARLDAAKELQQKDAEALRQQVAAVDKRVDDQLAQVGQAVDRYGVASAWIAILITVLVVLGGFLGYRNAKVEAKEAAKEVAKEEARKAAKLWFEQHAKELQTEIENLKSHAQSTVADLQNDVSSARKQVIELVDEFMELKPIKHAIEASEGRLNSVLDAGIDNDGPSSAQEINQEEEQQALHQLAKAVKSLLEVDRSFDAWNIIAHDAYATNQFEDAAYFWRKAAEVSDIPIEKVAQALFNRGVSQGLLKLNEAAIATYNELILRFSDATESTLCNKVAMAFVNMGALQGKNPSLYKKALHSFNEVVHRFSNSDAPELHRPVMNALKGKGIIQLLMAKNLGLQTSEAQDLLQASLTDFNKVLEHTTSPSGMDLGNQAYTLHLLGDAIQAEQVFNHALRAPKDGGEALYEATLKDLDMHPIPEDQAMRELVERAWAGYQQEQSNGPKEPPATPPPH